MFRGRAACAGSSGLPEHVREDLDSSQVAFIAIFLALTVAAPVHATIRANVVRGTLGVETPIETQS